MTAQDIINAVSQDIRAQLAASGADATTILDWVNRVQLQVLRRSRWPFMLSALKTFTTQTGVTDYFIGTGSLPSGAVNTSLALTDVRIIKRSTVFDRTNYKRLEHTDERPPSQSYVANNLPSLFRNDVSSPYVINLYPPPNGAYTIEFRYFKSNPQVTSTSTTLLIPDDYKDVVIAGVNAFAFKYLKQWTDAQAEKSIFDDGVISMIRDKNLGPTGGDFIAPDPASTQNQPNPQGGFWDGRN